MRVTLLVFLLSFVGFVRAEFHLDAIFEGIDNPWAMSFISDDKLIISQREGDLLLLTILPENIEKAVVEFAPDDLLIGGQGGILDIVPHPNYENNKWLYVSYSAGTNKDNYLKVQRITLDVDAAIPLISEIEDIFRVADSKDTPVHYAGRMVFDSQNNLLITSGDGFDYREKAQVKTSHLGKILRMSAEGQALTSNPFFDNPLSPQSYVYSYGHRNGQGLIILDDGTIVAHEHGPAGGDEVNVITAGSNYGWPVVTNGKDYIGSTISPFTDYHGMELPLVDWTPSIAPSSMIFYQGDKYPELQNQYLITSLKYKRIYVLNEKFEPLPDLFVDNERRLRDIEVNQQGDVYVLSDGDNSVLYRITRNN